MRIIRIFHPVGQGAFYSERHYNCQGAKNIVYDCGTSSSKAHGERIVSQAFREGEDIDILFISHFHRDHVNLINALATRTKIKRIVLPLMHDNIRYLIAAIYMAQGEDQIAQMVKDPRHFFRNIKDIQDVVVIGVREAEPEEELEEKPIDIDDLSPTDRNEGTSGIDRTVPSGTPLIVRYWEYVPYNVKHRDRMDKLRFELKRRGIDINRFIGKMEKGEDLTEDEKKKLQDAYNSLDGRINANSMFVYSGPREGWILGFKMFRICGCWFGCGNRVNCCSSKVACIYTGDGKMTYLLDPLWNRNKRIKRVGTIQIPHHGALSEFDDKVLDKIRHASCVISVGKKNRYGHPSPEVLGKIFLKDGLAIIVNEDEETQYMEFIVYWGQDYRMRGKR